MENKPKTEDGRNIIDHYFYWNNDAIIADLDNRRNNFGVLVSNLQNDFNIGSVVRNANAFLAKEVIIYGRSHWDRRGSVGTYNYTHFKKVKETDDLDKVLSDYDCIIGVDNIVGAQPIEDFQWDATKRTLLCFGQEHTGLPGDVLRLCHHIIYIKQYGSVRSLNVGCASAIVMYDYTNKIGRAQTSYAETPK